MNAGCRYCGLPLRLAQFEDSVWCSRACRQLYKSSDPRGTELRGAAVNALTPDSADKTRQFTGEGTERPEGVVGGVSSAVAFLRTLPRNLLSVCVPAEQAVPDTPGLDKPGHSTDSDAVDGRGGDPGRDAHSPQRPGSPTAQDFKSTSAEGNA